MFDHVGVVFRDLTRAGALYRDVLAAKDFDGNNIEAGVYADATEGLART